MSFRIPSTPNARSLFSQPSTTPAGPPPTWLTDKSTTPSGPPPRSTFGSSFNPSNNTFARKGFAAPDFEDDMDEDDAEYDEEGEEELDLPQTSAFLKSTASSPRGLKRSRDGQVRPASQMALIADGLLAGRKPMQMVEAPSDIVRCENVIQDSIARARRQPSKADSILADTSSQLTAIWNETADLTTKPGGFGPISSDGVGHAGYLASLLFQLHHPYAITRPSDSLRVVQRSLTPQPRKSTSIPLPLALLEWLDSYHRPLPDDFDLIHLNNPSPSAHEAFWDYVGANALTGRLDRVIRLLKDAGWEYADCAIDDGAPARGYTGRQLENTEEVVARCANTLEQCPGLQSGNWDVKGIEWTLFRQQVRRALEDLDNFAEGSGLDQSLGGQNIFQRSLLDSTMSLSHASRRAESRVPWTVLENLRAIYGILLGSVDDILIGAQDWLEASIFLTVWWDGSDESPASASLNKGSMRHSVASRPREADVTPSAAYRRRLADCMARVTTKPDDKLLAVNTLDLLQVGLACVLEDSVATVIDILRTLSPLIAVSVVEVAALGGWLPSAKPPAALGHGFSKEDLLVLSHGAQSPKTSPDSIDRNVILGEWAGMLAKNFEGLFWGPNNTRIADPIDTEGWELAIAVLNRQDQSSKSTQGISDLLASIDLSTEERVDKALSVCDEYGLGEQRRNIAERYADSLTGEGQPHSYGGVLIYYARANATMKLKSTLAFLTSLCLLHSTSMPTPSQIDDKLHDLLSHSRPALKDLAAIDPEAAQLLASHLSGYATLRQFYDLRDQDHLPPSTHDGIEKLQRPAPRLRPLARKRQAATALFGIIQSASDCISGGLFDPTIEAVVPIDGLLGLFGELLPFLGTTTAATNKSVSLHNDPPSHTRILSQQQVFTLLSILEDFLAAPTRIRQNAENLLHASLNAYLNHADPNLPLPSSAPTSSQSDLLVKSSTSWEFLAASTAQPNSATGSLIAQARAWDWRQGLVALLNADASTAADANDAHGQAETLIRLFREALVREVANGWGGLLGW